MRVRRDSNPATGFQPSHGIPNPRLSPPPDERFAPSHPDRLVVYGGQAYNGSATELGITRREADAADLPLRWSRPQLAISGDPRASGCIERRW